MQEQFVPYKQALELFKLGFNELSLGWFRTDKFLCYGRDSSVIGKLGSSGEYLDFHSEFSCLAPLWQQAFDWFRTQHGLIGNVDYLLNKWFCYTINDGKDEKTSRRLFTEFETYQEAQLECLKRLIKESK